MREELIGFEVAKLAKEKGFNWRNIEILEVKSKSAYLDNTTQSLLQRWLREVHNIHIMLEPYYNKNKNLVYGFDLLLKETEEEDICEDGFKTYEEALEVGLQEALKSIKNEKL